jgi:hypothetical protein
MEICEKTREKEVKMVEKIMILEERKNSKIEEDQRKHEELLGREKAKEKIIQHRIKIENERKIHREISQ